MSVLPFFLVLFLPGASGAASSPLDWRENFLGEVRGIDKSTPGKLGVWVKKFSEPAGAGHAHARSWYLSSLTKVPVAIAVLQKVDEGSLTLEQKVVLGEDAHVDGQGPLLKEKPGKEVSVGELLEFMLAKSDSTAADMLIGLVGEAELNERAKKMAPGLGTITSLRAVREQAYAQVHPKARNLKSADFMGLRNYPMKERHKALLRLLGLKASDAAAPSIPAAFEHYYALGLNSASLESFGSLLERLGKGELLSPEKTALLLAIMEKTTTGDRRIKSGLPKAVRFVQKTGTQIARMCCAGVVLPEKGEIKEGATLVVACLENFGGQREAEETLGKVGKALARSGALP